MSGEPSVRCYPDGPFLVRGPVKVLDDEGKEIEISRSVVALCRCGHSRKQPLCDGTHAAAGFRVTTDAEPERAR